MGRPKLSDFEKRLRLQIATNLKNLAKGMTQREISENTNIPASTLSGYFNETSTISPENLKILAAFFNVDPKMIDPRLGGYIPAKQNFGNVMVRNEKFRDPKNDGEVAYQLLLIKENNPAMLKPAAGEFEVVIRFNTSGKEFLIRCEYFPVDETGQRFYVTTNKAISAEDHEVSENNYDQYAAKISPSLVADIHTAVENAIKIYFLETIRKPLSIESYHNI